MTQQGDTSVAESGSLRQRVQAVIDVLRTAIQADGGDLDLVDVSDSGVVQVRFQGACRGCPGAAMTLHMLIERNLRARVPEITQVVAVQ